MIVQLRPPTRGTRNEYGMRSVAPTRLGMEMSQKIWLLSSANPAVGSRTATMLQSCQMTKPRNSAKIDHFRLRDAMARPPPFPLGVVLRVPLVDPAAGAVDERARRRGIRRLERGVRRQRCLSS